MSDHSTYIALAYGFALVVVLIMIVMVLRDYARQKSALKSLGSDWRP